MRKLLQYALPFVLLGCAVNAPYTSENFNEIKQRHQRIGVLPFEVTFNEEYKNYPLNGSVARGANFWREQERLAGLDMQKSLFIDLAKQVEKGRFEKVIQNYSNTNKMLQAAGIKIQEIPSFNKAELCEILGVDALLWGKTSIEVNPRSYNSSSDGATTLGGIYDAFEGELVWQKELIQRPSSQMDTPKSLGNETARQMAKILPY